MQWSVEVELLERWKDNEKRIPLTTIIQNCPSFPSSLNYILSSPSFSNDTPSPSSSSSPSLPEESNSQYWKDDYIINHSPEFWRGLKEMKKLVTKDSIGTQKIYYSIMIGPKGSATLPSYERMFYYYCLFY